MPDEPGQAEPLQPTEPGQGGEGQPGDGGAGAPAIEKFTVDGQDYTADAIRDLLKAKNDYGQFQPVFTKQQQLLKDPQQLRDYVTKTYPDLFPSQPAAPAAPDGLAPELQEAFKVLKEQGKFLTQEEAQAMAQKLVEDTLAQREAVAFIENEKATLSKEWDGQDGKPKFDFEAARQHALTKGFPTLTSAFEDLNKQAIREWYAANKVKPNVPTIARPGATGVPVSKKAGPDLNQMGAVKKDAEAFFGGDTE